MPPIEDQIRIAHLLGKVEGLITQRKQHLQQLDDLLKSVFLEMFGDPVRNEKGWGKKQFSELLDDIESGKSPKCEAREAAADEWGVLKLGAVTRCRFDENENKALPQDVLPSVRDEVKAGDLLFSRKNTYDLVAACAYVFKARPKLLMPDLIFRFVFKKNAEINPIFIWKLLICDSQRKRIQSLAAGAAGSMPNISKANLKTVLLPIPPWPLQNQFATIVEKVEGIKSHYQQSLTDLEALYGALSQQAFKGELDLSRVLLPAQSIAPVAIGDQATVPEPVVQTVTTIHLPDTGNLPAALEDSEARKALIAEWLEAYRQQLGDAPFSVQDFMVAASDRFTEWLQTVVEDEGVTDEQKNRLAEFYPSNDVGLDVNDYEHIKKWVFEALVANRLTQSRNVTGYDEQSGEPIFGNLIELRASQT
ncbi:restriction endonuclease subunit S [Pseudomonas aeruginosa]|uniref:restriction endonuclease subunit S n=1 Tax=Pseudomonas aeruginosa TaxID=287 RepID=UPI001EDEB98A|nr:restriction endonuclease subunit S [Pseudomonas aeruginosa]